MKKNILAGMLILSLTITGCGTADKNADKSTGEDMSGVTATNTSGNSTSSIQSNMAYLDKNNFKNNYTPFSFTDESSYTNLFELFPSFSTKNFLQNSSTLFKSNLC